MNMNSRISFKSNINFVRTENFPRRGVYVDYLDKDQIVSGEFFTIGVATCTAGGCIIPKKRAFGFHFLDNKKIVFPEDIIHHDNERGIIIGAKDLQHRPYSIPNFDAIKQYIQKRVENLSIFKQHKYKYAHSNIHYSLDTDTWSINTQYRKYWRSCEVKSIKNLLDVFKFIKIAKGDRLFFEGKEVLPAQFPSIFEK